MNWLNKMERKFGKYAIKNFTIYLLVCYGIGYIISMVTPTLLTYFTLEPALILKGQVWRLVSWVIVPPTSRFIYVVFMMLCYYSLGQTLERIWGTFRYNLYMFSGMLFTIIGTFIAYGVVYVQYHAVVGGIGNVVSTYYINMSIFLACAAIMPDMQVLFWGLIPVKMKWFAILDIVFVGMDLIWGGTVTRIIIVASLLNFVIFFFANRNMQRYNPKQVIRRRNFEKKVQRPIQNYGNGARHKCAVCGRTELDNPNLEFRYCSKCKGNYEYCSDHLFTHEHVK